MLVGWTCYAHDKIKLIILESSPNISWCLADVESWNKVSTLGNSDLELFVLNLRTWIFISSPIFHRFYFTFLFLNLQSRFYKSYIYIHTITRRINTLTWSHIHLCRRQTYTREEILSLIHDNLQMSYLLIARLSTVNTYDTHSHRSLIISR